MISYGVFGILRSRAFPKLYEDKLALIPLADLVNHSTDTTSEGSSWEIKEKGLFGREVMFSLRTPVDVIWRTGTHRSYISFITD
uniref:SET domain-containing protein n=1 Tax=Arundo donax TaxID=35708 RepID=A0A0A9EX87_ARUDO